MAEKLINICKIAQGIKSLDGRLVRVFTDTISVKGVLHTSDQTGDPLILIGTRQSNLNGKSTGKTLSRYDQHVTLANGDLYAEPYTANPIEYIRLHLVKKGEGIHSNSTTAMPHFFKKIGSTEQVSEKFDPTSPDGLPPNGGRSEDFTSTEGLREKKIETPSHYTGGVQTVTKQELVASHLEDKISGTKIHHILTALKYFDRAGEKIYDGMDAQQSLEKDCGKCADYLYRALEGVFLNELK